MNIASIQKLKIEFGSNLLFDNVTFDINEGDRVGLIGANGTGKTSLFKVFTGEYEPTDGGVFISKKIKIGYLEQHACQGSVKTVYEEALSVFSHLIDTEREITKLSEQIDKDPENRDALIERQSTLQEYFNANEGLIYKSLTLSALKGLGFTDNDLNITCDKLSGGQRSKLSMCKLLLSNADLILLDEPTNHLDINGTEWLEGFLLNYKGSVLVISHDRYFLDKICNKTVEIANKKSYTANGNYSFYFKLKEERLETERRHYKNQLEEIKRIEAIIEQQKSFARERNFITAESKRKMLEKKKAELIEPEPSPKQMKIKFETSVESGNDVLMVDSLKKSFGNKLLFENISFEVYKKDRAFIIGTNGCGKTTLLRILKNQMSADEGKFYFGSNVKIAYFDQSLESLRGGKTVLDEIWDEHRLLKEKEVRNYLAAFLFRGDDVYKNVDNLSGGEKAKLCLLKLMLSGANVLLLDEPTNHLDITSREILEEALFNFEGTIIAVSHDRYFINKLSTKIFKMEQSCLEKFDGTYDDYCKVILGETAVVNSKPKDKVNDYKLRKERESTINKLRGKIKRLEAEIDDIDNSISENNEKLTLPDVMADFEKIVEYTQLIEQLTSRQESLMEEWELLNSELSELTGD